MLQVTKINKSYNLFIFIVSESDSEEFNDGYDEQLMGDEEDRERLAQMTEKERETEIFKRIESREIMKTR